MLKNIVNLKYQSNLTIPFGKLQTVLDWCNHNCEKNWNYKDDTGLKSERWLTDAHSQYNIFDHLSIDYIFSFESEKDYIAFILVHE